ncbi:MAG: hypothetical protein ACRCTY_03005 [Candidatus Adiutrix sp.]
MTMGTTLQLYDKVQKKDNKISFNYVFLHGEADIDSLLQTADSEDSATNNLVLGTHSFKRNNGNAPIPVEFNIFQKHNQQHKYNTLFDYQNLLKDLRGYSSPVNIFIIGHSLETSDHAKLRILLCECKTADITIYYNDEISFEKYINNITEILGEEDVAARVKFRHQHDTTFGILQPSSGEEADDD